MNGDRIEQQLDSIEQRLGKIEGRLEGRDRLCQYEQDRIVRLEATVGKQNFIAAFISALTAGLTYAALWVASK